MQPALTVFSKEQVKSFGHDRTLQTEKEAKTICDTLHPLCCLNTLVHCLKSLLIQECSASGLTKREFCQQRGISEKSFYYWLKKLRTQMVGAAAPQLVQLESLPAKDSILEIHYRGAEMKLPSGVDMDVVAALLRSIQSL